MTHLTFPAARDVYLASLHAFEATNFDGMKPDDETSITNAHYDTWDAALQAPALTGANLLEKMSMIDARYMAYGDAILDVDWQAIRRDVASLTHINHGDDTEMHAAWRRFAMEHWVDPYPAATEQGGVDEKLLAEGIAHTPRGAAVKLRYAMWCRAKEPYLMAASLGASVPEIAELMKMADTDIVCIWTTIQSLEAMGAAA